MSSLIENTKAAKAAEKASKIKNGYEIVLKILENDLQGAEFLPGELLKLNVAEVVGDEFELALGRIGVDILQLGYGLKLWRSTSSRKTIYVEGIRPDRVDEDWEGILSEIKLRLEF